MTRASEGRLLTEERDGAPGGLGKLLGRAAAGAARANDAGGADLGAGRGAAAGAAVDAFVEAVGRVDGDDAAAEVAEVDPAVGLVGKGQLLLELRRVQKRARRVLGD